MRTKADFLKLYENVQRSGREELLTYLETSGYFMCPASTANHSAGLGGLCHHSVLVTQTMLGIAACVPNNISKESICIAGLFHDLGKAMYYGEPYYTKNVLKSGKQSDTKPFEINTKLPPVPHEVMSLQILSKFIKLTADESYSVLTHNALYTPTGNIIKQKESPLQMILHFSDLYCARAVEQEPKQYSLNLF